MSENINFFLDELQTNNNSATENDINDILNELETTNTTVVKYNEKYIYDVNETTLYTYNKWNYMEKYYAEFTTKELLKIFEFYGLRKRKNHVYCKFNYITDINEFESNPENYEYVEKRQRFWSYMSELKNDPVMKKYIIWN